MNDFQKMSDAAEAAVQLIRDRSGTASPQNTSGTHKPPKTSADAASSLDSSSIRIQAEQKTKTRPESGKPVSLFNTRIPPEMNELLDDPIYRLKKQGSPHTKQQLAHEALCLLFEKYTLI